jgi:hypothetical protein
MIKHGIINPLNVLESRRLDFRPPHFTRILLEDLWVDIKTIDDWIYTNLECRYSMSSVSIDNNEFVEIGFENPSEASMFGLVINQINRRPDLL